MVVLSNMLSVASQDIWLKVILCWSLVALVVGSVLMLIVNLLQNPPWPQGEDPSRPWQKKRR